jgi:hypothetical protein
MAKPSPEEEERPTQDAWQRWVDEYILSGGMVNQGAFRNHISNELKRLWNEEFPLLQCEDR